MGFGKRTLDNDKVRDALLNYAAADAMSGKPTEKTYLAALYAEQVKTNELLEEVVRNSSAGRP